MIAAEALQVPQENVFISETATNTVANTSSTAASASSDLNGYAIWNACEQLNERLKPFREQFGPDATMKQLAHAAYFDRVNLSANGFYKVRIPSNNPSLDKGCIAVCVRHMLTIYNHISDSRDRLCLGTEYRPDVFLLHTRRGSRRG